MYPRNKLLIYIRDCEYRICIPRIQSLLMDIVKELHNFPLSRDLGCDKTCTQMGSFLFWPKMHHFIEKNCRSNPNCQRKKPFRQPSSAPLQSLSFRTAPWEMVSLDVVTELPHTCNYNSIFVVIDYLTKMEHLFPTASKGTAVEVANLLIDNIFRLHGLLQNIVSDRDPKFTSQFWKALFRLP